jgi:hypothetical protein
MERLAAGPGRDGSRQHGQPLDASTRAFFEARLGHDFSRVRVHAESEAARSARGIGARAYAIGDDVVFSQGQYAPHSLVGLRLLAHELAHTVQQSAHGHAAARNTGRARSEEQEAESATDSIFQGGDFHPRLRALPHVAAQDQSTTNPPAGAGTPQAMTRAKFDVIMKDRYRVNDIHTGTFEEQAFGNLKREDWTSWDPGASAEVYGWIVEAFVNFEATFGGLPAVKTIVFFDVEYERGPDDNPVPHATTGASFSGGRMAIYREVQSGNKMFNLKGALDRPTPEQAVRRNIAHELGHGVIETALTQRTDQPPGADPDLIKDYRRAVGWAADGNLYDIQQKPVQDAFRDEKIPPAEFWITPNNFATKPWKELPLTGYMASRPDEDFGEAIMAYVYEPERLKTHSPARYKFIDERKARWLESGQPKLNIWERVKRGGRARTLQPSRPQTIWERTKEAAAP